MRKRRKWEMIEIEERECCRSREGRRGDGIQTERGSVRVKRSEKTAECVRKQTDFERL